MSQAVRDSVERHAQAFENLSAALTKSGIGGHATRGHAIMATKLANDLRSTAALGQIPYEFRDNSMYASAPRLSAQATAVLREAGLEGTERMTLEALNASLDASGTSAGDRFICKEAMAASGRITA
jgi:hypothetical protein